MKTKSIFAFAASALMLASCANEDLVSPNVSGGQDGNGTAMTFGVKTGNMTRATNDLNENGHYNFGVWAIKANDNSELTSTKFADDPTNVIMKDYLVGYKTDGTNGYTNTGVDNMFDSNWFYEKLGYEDGNSTDSNVKNQFLKYWDGGKTYSYFFAYTPYKKGSTEPTFVPKYTNDVVKPVLKFQEPIAMNADPDGQPMFAGQVEVNSDHLGTAKDVPMEFIRMMSQVEIAIHEDIPGYYVQLTNVQFGGEDKGIVAIPTEQVSTTPVAYSRGKIVTEAKPAVLFDLPDDGSGKPAGQAGFGGTITFVGDPTQSDDDFYLTFTLPEQNASQTLTKDIYLNTGRVNKVKSAKVYNMVPNNGLAKRNSGLQFVFNFDLVSEDTGEVIHVKNARAYVAHSYTAWAPNTKYTYVFRITKDTTGNTTGGDPTPDPENPEKALYPIVFDGITVATWNGVEYIDADHDFVVNE